MAEQMTTRQSVAAAQAAGTSSNVAGAQHGAQHLFLSIITIQQAQSTCSETLEFEVSHAGASILSLLSDIKNLVKLKKINDMKLIDLNFCE